MKVGNNEAFYNDQNNLSPIAYANSCLDQNSRTNQNQDIISIFVLQPFERIRHIKISIHSKLSLFEKIYPKDSIYILYGKVLDRESSISSNGIINGDKIVLISSNKSKNNSEFVEQWISITSDREQFEDKMNLNIKKESRLEIARLKDIKIFKNELKCRSFGITHCSLNNNSRINSTNEKNSNELNIDYQPLDQPSSAALPLLW